MTDQRDIRNQVIGGVLTTAIIAAGVWGFGFAPSVLNWLFRESLPIPGYVVGLLGLGGIGSAARKLWRRRLPISTPAEPIKLPRSTKAFELRPVSFTLDLLGVVPRIRVDLLAINYQTVPLSLRQVVVSRLTFASGFPGLDGINLIAEAEIMPCECRMVHCERHLVDSEARAVHSASGRPLTGSVSVLARGVSEGVESDYRASSLVITGWADSPRPDVA